MGHFFLSIVAVLVVASQLVVAGCHSTMTSDDYWRSMLPNTPMPTGIREHLSSGLKDPADGAREGGDAIITGPDGNPVTIHRNVRKAAARIYLYPNANPSGDAIISGPEGNPVTIHRSVRKAAARIYLYPKSMDTHGHDLESLRPNANPSGDAIISGPEGNPVTIHRDVRKAAARIYLYPKNMDGHHHDQANIPNKEMGSSNAQGETWKEGGDATITGPEGNPVTIHRDVRKAAARIYLYPKNTDGHHHDHLNFGDSNDQTDEMIRRDKLGDDAVITGPQGNPVTIHRDVRKAAARIYLYPKNMGSHHHDLADVLPNPNANDKDSNGAQGDAIIAGPQGNPVTIHRDVRKAAARIYLYPKNMLDGHRSEPVMSTDSGRSNAMVDESNLRIDRPSALFFFLEKDLHVGAEVEVMFKRPLDGDHFLAPRMAGSIPFSSSKLPEILDRFSIPPDSFEAKEMKRVHYFCELPPAPGESMHCATSLESMVHFIASSLNGSAPNMNVRTLSSTTDQKETASLQLHTVASISPVPTVADTSVACHLVVYPYTVYHCHKTHGTKPYVIKLVRQSDGSTVEAAAACHRDTSDWDPNHYALKALGMKPGEASVCHFFAVGDFAFIPASTAATNNIAAQQQFAE